MLTIKNRGLDKKVMSVDLLGTVNRNRKKSNKDKMLPIYELISNAINAEVNNEGVDKNINIKITIEVENKDKKNAIKKIIVEDEGVGFNEEQRKSFKSINSSQNIKYGCKGIGKYYILRSFNTIQVESFDKKESVGILLSEKNYNDDNLEGLNDFKPKIFNTKTIITCFYFEDESELNKDFYKAKPISFDLETFKERVYSYFIVKLSLLKEKGFNINLSLNEEQIINDINLPNLEKEKNDIKIKFDNKEYLFLMYHLQTEKNYLKTNNHKNYVQYIADRVIVEDSDARDGDAFKNLPLDFLGNQNYILIVESDFLNDNASDDRSKFEIDKQDFDIIKNKVNEIVKNRFKNQISLNRKQEAKKAREMIDKYPFLESTIREKFEKKEILSYENIDDAVPKIYAEEATKEYKTVNNFLKEIDDFKRLLATQDLTQKEQETPLFYREQCEEKSIEIAKKIPEIYKHLLSKVVFEEYLILERLAECLRQQNAQEQYIHNIVFPRYDEVLKKRGKEIFTKQFDEDGTKLLYKDANLWLVDDSFIGYNYKYGTSDFEIGKFDENILKLSEPAKNYQEIQRPDIAIFQEEKDLETGEPVLIIEFKKPNSDSKIWEIIGQAGDYALTLSNLDHRYTRFVCLCINSISEQDDVNLMSKKYAVIKKMEHYYFVDKSRINNQNKDITLTIEVLTNQRFIELAVKRKERYFNALGLKKPKNS